MTNSVAANISFQRTSRCQRAAAELGSFGGARWALPLLLCVLIAGCSGHETPTQTNDIRVESSFPQTIQIGQPFQFTVTLQNLAMGRDWDIGLISVGIPIETLAPPAIVSTNGTDAQVIRGSPESGGWEVFVARTPFLQGASLTVTASAVVQAGSASGSATIQFFGNAHDLSGTHPQESTTTTQQVAIVSPPR